MADDSIDILPKDKGDRIYGFKVSDIQTGGMVVLGLGLAAVALKVFAPDLFKPAQPQQPQEQQPQYTQEQIEELRRRVAEQNALRQQMLIDNAQVDVSAPTVHEPISNANYQDNSVDAIVSRHDKYNADTPTVDSFDMDYDVADSGYDESNPNIHKYIKTISD